MIDDSPTDGELLAATARGDGTAGAAFTRLVRRHIRSATLLATQFLGDPDEAEDVVQDAFTIVHRSAGDFDPARPFPPWLFAIVRRIAANRLARSRRRRRLLSLWKADTASDATTPPPDGALVARLEAAAVYRAMSALPPMQRACFDLVVMRDLAPREVAAMHGISESTVRQHVFRARAALRSVLE